VLLAAGLGRMTSEKALPPANPPARRLRSSSGLAAARALRSRTLARPAPRSVTWANGEETVQVRDHGLDGIRLLRAWPAGPAESPSAEKFAR